MDLILIVLSFLFSLGAGRLCRYYLLEYSLANKDLGTKTYSRGNTQATLTHAPEFQSHSSQPAIDLGSNGEFYFRELDTLFHQKDYFSLEMKLRELAASDPLRAIEWCNHLPPHEREAALVPVLGTWLENDSALAFKWAKENCGTFFESSEFTETCAAIGNFRLAADGLGTVQNRELRGLLLTKLGGLWGDSDENRKDLVNLASSLDVSQRHSLYEGMIERWALSDPEAALELARISARSTSERAAFTESAVKGWVAADGAEEAATFLQNQPNSRDLYGAYRAVALAYATESPEKVANWLKTNFTESKFLDGAVIGPAVKLMNSRPDIATNLFSMTSDPKLLEKRLAITLPLWAAKDPQAAYAFVANAPNLSGEQRSRLGQLIK